MTYSASTLARARSLPSDPPARGSTASPSTPKNQKKQPPAADPTVVNNHQPMNEPNIVKRSVAEIIGTFSLVFCGTGAIVIDKETGGGVSHAGVAVTFGLIVMAMIYGLGEISGAHLNPAVSIAFTLAGRLPVRSLAPYIASQLVGALLASATLRT